MIEAKMTSRGGPVGEEWDETVGEARNSAPPSLFAMAAGNSLANEP